LAGFPGLFGGGGVVRLHERTALVSRAKTELNALVWEWMDKRDVTYVEAVRCLLEVTSNITRYQLRMERFPDDPDHKADEAADDDDGDEPPDDESEGWGGQR
jgi:hypothetical protein